jgi:hypothetical protein
MKTSEEVAEMLRLSACEWGKKRTARHLGCSHHTVEAYLGAGGVKAFKTPGRAKVLVTRRGCASGSFDMVAMPMWSGRSLSAEKGLGVTRAPSSEQ